MLLNNIFGNNIEINNEQKKRPISQIHLRIQQRSKTTKLTIIEGLASDLDLKKITRALKKTLNTGASVIRDKDDNFLIQVSGDHRYAIKDFFVMYKIWEEPDPEIKIYGY